METSYTLTDEELAKVQFSVRYICDRQFNPDDNIQWVMERLSLYNRWDMFWVDCKFEDVDLGAYCIDPSLVDPVKFAISKNYNKVSNHEFLAVAEAFFLKSPEYQQQIQWIKKLQETFDKYGGVREFFNECFKLKNLHDTHKLKVCIKHRKLFENGNRKELDGILGFEDVFRTTSGCFSGVDHLIWFYNTHVKGK